MKFKFYVILIETQKDDETKTSTYFGGFSQPTETDTGQGTMYIKETDIPNAVKFSTKTEVDSMCGIIKEYITRKSEFATKLYTMEIEAVYTIQSVVES